MSNHDFSALSPLEQFESVVNATRSATLQMFQDKKYGVTIDQWKVLEAASKLDTPTQSNIAASSGKDPAAVTRMIALMEKNGIVKRKATKGDKRSHHISLTRKGSGLVKKIGPALAKMSEKALTNISSRDMSTLKRIAQTIADNVA